MDLMPILAEAVSTHAVTLLENNLIFLSSLAAGNIPIQNRIK